MKIRTCSVSVHKGYMCMHAHHSIHKVCLGKFFSPSFSEWACCAPTPDVANVWQSPQWEHSLWTWACLPPKHFKTRLALAMPVWLFTLHVCELHFLNVFVCQHWDWHCSQHMLQKSWPTARPRITDWLIIFRSLWTVSWDSAKCLTWR